VLNRFLKGFRLFHTYIIAQNRWLVKLIITQT